MNKESLNKGKLGMFVVVGILLFIVTISVIGINRNLFGSNFILNSQFKNVSGLKVGSNVRLSGINIGTVSKIEFIKVFPQVFAGTHVSHPAVEIVRSRNVAIESKAIAYADGERIGQLPISAECIHDAAQTWVA